MKYIRATSCPSFKQTWGTPFVTLAIAPAAVLVAVVSEGELSKLHRKKCIIDCQGMNASQNNKYQKGVRRRVLRATRWELRKPA